MKRGISTRLSRIEESMKSLGGCRHCRDNRAVCFLFGDEPTPEPCAWCGSSPDVTRFVIVDPKNFEKFGKPP